MRLLAATPAVPSARRLTGATVAFSDGTVAAANLEDGDYRLDLTPRLIDSFTVTVTGTIGNGTAPVGLAEVNVFGVNAEEWIESPTDVAQAAAEHPPLVNALERAPVAYAFERAIGEGPVDEEVVLRRRFVAFRDDALGTTGRLRLQASTGDDVLGLIEPSAVRISATNRLLGGLQFRAGLMVDGDPETGWVADPDGENRIDLAFAPRQVDSVRIEARHGEGLSTITEARIEAGPTTSVVTFEAQPCDASQCPAVATADLGGVDVDSMTVTITGIDRAGQQGSQPIRIDEIEIDGIVNELTVDPEQPSPECIEGLVQFDGRPLLVRLHAPRALVLAGLPVPWEACAPIQVAPGVHELQSLPAATVDTAVLAPVGFADPTETTQPAFSIISQTPTSFTVDVDAPDGGVVSIGQSWHPAWTATLDGTDLGEPIELDTTAAWRLPPGSSGVVEVRFAWQRQFEVALAITLASVVLCLGIVLRGRRP